jgi:small-conductance mechanosensitive channel
VRRITARTLHDPTTRYQISTGAAYALGLLAVVVLGKIWFRGVTGVATYLGLLSAGLAVALQDPLTNLAGWLFLVIRRPFEVGDRIQIGPHTGDVLDVRLFQFVVLEIGNWVEADQTTGRILHIPNGWVFKNPQANFDKGFRYIWNELSVVVTFESNWRRAKDVLTRLVDAQGQEAVVDAAAELEVAAGQYPIKFSKLTPMVWTSVVENGVKLTLRYLCKPRERRSSEHRLWESILEEFRQLPDVDFAYPTMRRLDYRVEGRAVPEPVGRQAGRTDASGT